ncbi:hypothetical protein SDC9_101887 [bioreactor metagenome]|uniref:Uncharacterized protein n=1 Tax=bioreactor metagenome TaxID=1076179 RepID=A0A645APC1_9ZZZZ
MAEKSADFNVGEGDPKAIGASAIFDTCGPAALEFEGLKNYYPTDVIGGFFNWRLLNDSGYNTPIAVFKIWRKD